MIQMLKSFAPQLILEYSTTLRAHRQPNWMTYGFINKIEDAKVIKNKLLKKHKKVDIRVWRYSTALGSTQVL